MTEKIIVWRSKNKSELAKNRGFSGPNMVIIRNRQIKMTDISTGILLQT